MVRPFWMVCINTVCCCCFSWYHGKISREEAEALLNDFREEGDFLIRDSVHFQGDYTLSIYFEGMVDHYRIIAKHNKLEVDGGDCLFDNLIQLVEVLFLLFCWHKSVEREKKVFYVTSSLATVLLQFSGKIACSVTVIGWKFECSRSLIIFRLEQQNQKPTRNAPFTCGFIRISLQNIFPY